MKNIFENRTPLLLPIFLSALFLSLFNQAAAYSDPSVNPTGGTGSIYIEASTPANSLYLKSNGNVGIGATNPDSGLTNAKRTTKTSGLIPVYLLTDTAVGGREWGIFSGSPSIGYFKIRDNTASADRLVIDTSGNIGIGKANPGTALDVNGTVTATAFAGPLSGTISAGNVSSGNFGANTGGGNYAFPTNVGFGSSSAPLAKIHIFDSANSSIEMDEFGSSGNWIRFRTALGTQASPTAVTSGTSIGGLSISGHDGTGMAGMSTGLQAFATENWTSTAHGSALAFYSTPNASAGNYERLRIDQNGRVGIGTSAPATTLDVNGTTRLQKTSVGGNTTERFYPEVVSSAQDGTVSGAWIINTPIPRSSNLMFRIRVHGYAYGTPDSVDFTVVGYPYSGSTGSIDGATGAVVNYKLQDEGTDSWSKYVGINSAGNVAIAFGDIGNSAYYYRLSVDAWITRTTTDYSSASWSITQSTTSNFGFLDIHGPLVSYNNTCVLVSYSSGTTTSCPAGYYTWSGTALASGSMLCCRVRNPM